jgi:hypothetical protein
VTTAEPARNRQSIGAATIAMLAIALVVAAVVLAAGRGRDDFGPGAVGDVTAALIAQGLTVCSTDAPDDGGDGDGTPVASRVIAVALAGQCATALNLQVDEYSDAGHRDAAAREAESRLRPRAYGTVYTWARFTLYLQGDDASGSTDAGDRIVAALDSIGAH